MMTTDEAIESVRKELEISEGWIAISYEERQLTKYAIDAKMRIAELQAKLSKVKEGLKDMIFLSAGLNEDDSWFGERRDANERIKKAETLLTELQDGMRGDR